MPGTARHARLETPTARARLAAGRQQHWQTLIMGRGHLGYQRWPQEPAGHWLVRRYAQGRYSIRRLAVADDQRRADGHAILSYEQAKSAATAELAAPPAVRSRMTVREAMAAYIDHLNARGQATDDIERRTVAHILPTLGERAIEDLTTTQLGHWLAALARAPARKRSPAVQQKFKPAPRDEETIRARRNTANRVGKMFKAALNHAYAEGHVGNADAWGRRWRMFRGVGAARVRYLSLAEAQRFLNACDPEFRPLARGALESGARYGELCALVTADFCPDAGTLTIRRSKSGRARHVFLTAQGQAFFRAITTGRAGDARMFTRANGRPWGAACQGRFIRRALAHAQIAPAISFHGLRHTWASLAVMNGVPLTVVSANLGHTTTAMCERHYSHLAPSYVADAIRAGAPQFGPLPASKVEPLRR